MNTASEPAVSIITPVHNGAQYLAECIESVLAQTYQNWDYTIVNNCSSDGTLEVAQHYAAKDPRIRVHDNQEFLQVVANHNHALRQVSPASKYCKLVFGDDWLFPECLERMVALAEANPSVGIVGAYGLQDRTVMWTGLPYPSTVVPGREACRQRLLNGPYVFGTGTSHMFRADLVRNRDPFYNEANLHCDSEVCFQILQSCDFGFIHQILSYTRAPDAVSLTGVGNQLHTLEAMTLYELITYGPVFLTPEELRACRKAKFDEYYAFLAHSALEGRESWDFHKKKLNEFGLTLDRGQLAKAVVVKGMNALLRSPKQTITKLFKGKSVVSGRLHAVGGRLAERD
jgi:glycosyltransferase involved in cell wall biosynthesis